MKYSDYVKSKTEGKQKAIPADIRANYDARVVKTNLFAQSSQGTAFYLSHYGKGIAAPKCVFVGRLALELGHSDFAIGFFLKAAELENVDIGMDGPISDVGKPEPVNPNGGLRREVSAQAVIDGFPTLFQPGKFATMQPSDARLDREDYIVQPGYWGQPKIDGNKMLVFATPTDVYYQSRQLKLNPSPHPKIDYEFKKAAFSWGNFILEGEITYLDCEGKEHRTGAQALTANRNAGHPEMLPEMQYVVFACVWREARMLRQYGDMVTDGFYIASEIQQSCPLVRPIETEKTTDAKQCLVNRQQQEGREGEVWFRPGMEYIPGKHSDDRFVRTKYLAEFEAIVTGFTETTAEGHAFGAMSIQSLDGKDLGNVGTGFTREDKRELMRRFQVSRHGNSLLRVEIRCQGFTEGPEPKAWHARFLRIVE